MSTDGRSSLALITRKAAAISSAELTAEPSIGDTWPTG
jgi:hypothetical protein